MKQFRISVNGNAYDVQVEEIGGLRLPLRQPLFPLLQQRLRRPPLPRPLL